MTYNAKRHAALLRRAADAVDNGDWLTMGRALALAEGSLPAHIRRSVRATSDRRLERAPGAGILAASHALELDK